MFESPERLVLGLLSGIAFGVLLHKGRVGNHSVIMRQLLLREHTVLKVMLTAAAVGSAGYWALVALGLTPVEVKPAQMGGVIWGALLFGTGLAVLGYCPGTTVAAVGAGHRDAIAGLLGLFAGAGLFVYGYPVWDTLQKTIVDWGKITLPAATGVPPAAWVIALAIGSSAIYYYLRKHQGHTPTHSAR